MKGVDAVIITTGYSGSLLNPGGFKKIDQEVRMHMFSHMYTYLYPGKVSTMQFCSHIISSIDLCIENTSG